MKNTLSTKIKKIILLPLLATVVFTSGCQTAYVGEETNIDYSSGIERTLATRSGIDIIYRELAIQDDKLILPIYSYNISFRNIDVIKRNIRLKTDISDLKISDVTKVNNNKILVSLSSNLFSDGKIVEDKETLMNSSLIFGKNIFSNNEGKIIPLSIILPKFKARFKSFEIIDDEMEIRSRLSLRHLRINGIRNNDLVFEGEFKNAKNVRINGNELIFTIPIEDIEGNYVDGKISIVGDYVNTLWGEKFTNSLNSEISFSRKTTQGPQKAIGFAAATVAGAAICTVIFKSLGGMAYYFIHDYLGNDCDNLVTREVKELSDNLDILNQNLQVYGDILEEGLTDLESTIDKVTLSVVQEYAAAVEGWSTTTFANAIVETMLIEDVEERLKQAEYLYEEMCFQGVQDYVDDVYNLGGFMISTGLGTGDSILDIYDNGIKNTYNWLTIDVNNLFELWKDDLIGDYVKGVIISCFYYSCLNQFEGLSDQYQEEVINKYTNQLQTIYDLVTIEEYVPLNDAQSKHPRNMVNNIYYYLSSENETINDGKLLVFADSLLATQSNVSIEEFNEEDEYYDLYKYNLDKGALNSIYTPLDGTFVQDEYNEMQSRARARNYRNFYEELDEILRSIYNEEAYKGYYNISSALYAPSSDNRINAYSSLNINDTTYNNGIISITTPVINMNDLIAYGNNSFSFTNKEIYYGRNYLDEESSSLSNESINISSNILSNILLFTPVGIKVH